MRALLDWIRLVYPPRTLAITLVVTLIVWFAGPIGTFEAMHPVFRLIYWGGLIFGSVPVAHSFRRTVTRRLGNLSAPVSALVTAAGFSCVYTPVVYITTLLAARYDLATMVPWWTMWEGTFLAVAGAYVVRALLIEQDQKAAATASVPHPAGPRLLQRIDRALHGRLVSISVRDHYVDVRTEAGQTSLLMRFSDAMAETEGVEGAQVHRSHWVAWDAVEAVERQGSNLILRMAHGAPIPVSRNHREKLGDRGLI